MISSARCLIGAVVMRVGGRGVLVLVLVVVLVQVELTVGCKVEMVQEVVGIVIELRMLVTIVRVVVIGVVIVILAQALAGALAVWSCVMLVEVLIVTGCRLKELAVIVLWVVGECQAMVGEVGDQPQCQSPIALRCRTCSCPAGLSIP